MRVSAVLCTWNRAALLEGALAALAAQDRPPSHEILIVDNASRDRTSEVVSSAAARYPQIRYVYEPRQGLSHARNAALRQARGALVLFTDDDVRVASDWMARMTAAFDEWPDAACIGGPVLPEWPQPAPAWLTKDQWAPLGVQDHGAGPFRVDASRPVCLIGANVAFRRDVLEAMDGFNPLVQRVGDAGGTTEDHELHLRLWATGHHGMYDPRVRATALVLPQRLRKAHHRAWHFGHGRHVARMRIPDMEQTRAGRVFGVPAHVLRQAAEDAWGCAASIAAGDAVRAFEREARLWFTAGYLRERWI